MQSGKWKVLCSLEVLKNGILALVGGRNIYLTRKGEQHEKYWYYNLSFSTFKNAADL